MSSTKMLQKYGDVIRLCNYEIHGQQVDFDPNDRGQRCYSIYVKRTHRLWNITLSLLILLVILLVYMVGSV